MRSLKIVALTLVLGCQAGSSVTQDIPTKKSSFIAVSVKIDIKATPDKVWDKLTSAEGIRSILNYAFDDVKGATLAKVGDHAAGTLEGDHGMLIVSYAKPAEEIRMIWEPDKGHYVCSARIQLTAGSGGTVFQVTDSYSDDQANVDETSDHVRKEYKASLPAFKLLAEK